MSFQIFILAEHIANLVYVIAVHNIKCLGFANFIICLPSKGTATNVDDNTSLERHSRRLEEELKKRSPNEKVVRELMTAEFIRCRIFIKQLDVGTRVRETLTKYPILANGHHVH